jgi:dolichol-phosphate mannosyltransferase
MTKDTHISIVIPVYGCQSCLKKLYERLNKTLLNLCKEFEIILVDDRSRDNAWDTISELSISDQRVKGIRLSRNFGQSKAITAGLDYACGEWIVVMDCDLQDQPEEIPKLYSKANEGYDIVFGKRTNRKDSFFKKLRSDVYFALYNYLTENNTDSRVSNFSIISKKVLIAFRQYREHNAAYTLSVNLLGFKRADIEIDHAKRGDGQSSYSVKKLFDIAVDAIISQSNKPLSMSIKFGFMISILSFLYAVWLVLRYFIYGVEIVGWTSVMVSIYFIGGLIFVNLGLVGLYIGKIFNETKSRPLYLIDKITWDQKNKDS